LALFELQLKRKPPDSKDAVLMKSRLEIMVLFFLFDLTYYC
jgi:hypothetical protein